MTINPFLEVEQYPLPKPDELFATLAGGKKFTKIDLTNAYQQMALDEDSSTRGYHQHASWPLPVHPTPFWSGIRTGYLPKGYGYGAARVAKSYLLSR